MMMRFLGAAGPALSLTLLASPASARPTYYPGGGQRTAGGDRGVPEAESGRQCPEAVPPPRYVAVRFPVDPIRPPCGSLPVGSREQVVSPWLL
jgi:hypothetical protein